MLEWLWNSTVGPVLDALGFTQYPTGDNWPRVWWIPTGPLSKFPLHAAGLHLDGSINAALDQIISSHSPSVKVLIYGRRHGL